MFVREVFALVFELLTHVFQKKKLTISGNNLFEVQ
jgi:hypothetical protein